MNNLLKVVKNIRNKWFIISAVILILGIVIILFKSNSLTGLRPSGAMVTITMEETNYDKAKFLESVNKVDPKAIINYIDSDSKVDVVTTTKEKADGIFNQVKTDFSLKADKPDVSGEILYKAISFNIETLLSIIGACLIFSFVVFWFLLGYKYALSNLASNIVVVILALAVFLILNLPLGMPFAAMIVLSIILLFYFDMTNSIIMKDHINKLKKIVMEDLIEHMYAITLQTNVIASIIVLLSLLILAIIISFLRRYSLASFIVIFLSLYLSYFLTSPLWLKLKEGKKTIK